MAESPETPRDAKGPSAGSSAGSSTASSSPYTAGAGPGFDPNQAPEIQETDAERDERGALFAEEWQEQQVRDWLKNAGDLAHAGVGVGEFDWVMTQRDLERIAPPLTRILNRYEPTRAAAGYSDPASVAIGFGLYGWRSTLERVHVLRAQAEAEQAPAGVAPGFTPPPPPPAASNGAAPAPGPGQPGHIPVIGEDGAEQPSFADRLRQTRPPEAS